MIHDVFDYVDFKSFNTEMQYNIVDRLELKYVNTKKELGIDR